VIIAMALINIDTALKETLSRLKRLSPGGGIEILSYKRNRGIELIRKNEGTVLIHERGYVEREMTAEIDELPKLLKGIFRTEFPRSRKVRVYRISGSNKLTHGKKRL
jgi:ArsR family metal-binding transcriptional regulator